MSTKRSLCKDHDISSRYMDKIKPKSSAGSKGDHSVSPQERRECGEYTVGWICAIPTEYVAAQAFLDATHSPPESIPVNDNNNYTLGEIGKHNVVIAVLPMGTYGTTSAASVARDMLHTFPNVRTGLMVGIGGGAPSSEHDIRLGDIVVSIPYNGEGGVFQYDFGKAIQDKKFVATGHLNKPPILLAAAVSSLEAQYVIDGHQLVDSINSVLEKKPRLKKKFKRPDLNTDKLYRSEVTHPADDKAKCTEDCGDDSSKLVPRQERTQDDDNPAIHYGIIASANQLMKNAVLRDKYAKENGVLCFEMEAAGLMDHFPCLVIRGICDYSDTHKNKEWQGYAAMAAAAYAKDLLSRILVNQLEAERRITDIISSVGRVEQRVDEVQRDVKDLARERRQAELSRWLSPPDPSTNYNKALQQRQEGTGVWFLKSNAFAAWKSQGNSLLWLYGIPGCGKTILSSIIVEHLQRLSIQNLLYFYFDFADAKKETLRGVVCSLIMQLYYRCKSAQEPLDALFSSEDRNTQPSCESLCKVLHVMIDRAEEVWIVLDAIDECTERKGDPIPGLLLWMRDLVTREDSNVRCLVTSRPEDDIRAELGGLTSEKNRISIQSNLVNNDILTYIYAKVRNGEGLKRWRSHPDIQKEIEERLAQKAQGMFRWVTCQIKALEDCLDPNTLRSALDSLPETLDETYARMIKAIPARRKQTALRILQFLMFSERPLRINEAVDAIAVNTDSNPHFSPKNRMPKPVEITGYCSSLVVMVSAKGYTSENDEGHMELQLAHFSVKEYLMSNRLDNSIGQVFQETAARASIARVCLAYLLHLDQVLTLQEVRKGFPFAEYCATYWMSHTGVAGCEKSELLELVERLFCYQTSSYRLCYCLYRPDEPWYNRRLHDSSEPAPALYYAAFGGLKEVVRLLLSKNANVNAQGGHYGNALQAASYGGHEQIVELLLNNSANINAQGGHYSNALQAASYRGHEQIMELLLSKGADINAQGEGYGSALEAASAGGHKQVVTLLLDKGAKVNTQSTGYGNALQAASFHGHKQVVELLLSRGANINTRSGVHTSALQAASYSGHEQIVKVLLNNSANVNAKGFNDDNALQVASFQGHEQIVELLLSKGAEINTQGGHYRNVLRATSFQGCERIVKLLLNKGADINTQGGHYDNALQADSAEGHEQMVEVLLNKGAELESEGKNGRTQLLWSVRNAHEAVILLLLLHKGAGLESKDNEYGRTPPSWAASDGRRAFVELLLDKHANLESKDKTGQTPLSWAASIGGEGVVKLLLSKGADPNSKDNEYGRTPLSWAASIGGEGVVKLLLSKGADLESEDKYRRTPLSWAASNGCEGVVKLLLNKGADPNSKDNEYGRTPLSWAASIGGEGVVKLLLSKGADLESEDKYRRTPLSWAASNGCEGVVNLLLSKGADLESEDKYRRTPMSWAAKKGYKAVVELLLNKGADLKLKDKIGRTPLWWAAIKGHEVVVKLLLDKGILESKSNDYDQEQLLVAAMKGNKAAVELLLKKGADIESRDDECGWTPLLWAAKKGHKAVVELLLNEGADIESKDEGNGRTLLSWAASNGREAVVQLLLSKEADLESKDRWGRTPLFWAVMRGHKAVVELLVKQAECRKVQAKK